MGNGKDPAVSSITKVLADLADRLAALEAVYTAADDVLSASESGPFGQSYGNEPRNRLVEAVDRVRKLKSSFLTPPYLMGIKK